MHACHQTHADNDQTLSAARRLPSHTSHDALESPLWPRVCSSSCTALGQRDGVVMIMMMQAAARPCAWAWGALALVLQRLNTLAERWPLRFSFVVTAVKASWPPAPPASAGVLLAARLSQGAGPTTAAAAVAAGAPAGAPHCMNPIPACSPLAAPTFPADSRWLAAPPHTLGCRGRHHGANVRGACRGAGREADGSVRPLRVCLPGWLPVLAHQRRVRAPGARPDLAGASTPPWPGGPRAHACFVGTRCHCVCVCVCVRVRVRARVCVWLLVVAVGLWCSP